MARKILLADDSVTAQNMGRKILADAGYEVITVNNGSAALKKIAEHKPDLIVLDVYMPGYSGLEVCQRLKESQETSRVPVLLTVGKLEPFKPEEAKRVRADGFIVKPFEASELLSALSKLEDKIVPRTEGAKVGRFGRTSAGFDEGRYDKTVAADEDSGWKSRIAFPSKKKKAAEEDGDDPAIYNAVNKDLRTVVERKLADTSHESKQHETKQNETKQNQAQPNEAKQEDARVDLGALAPEGLPKDVTPEEIAALAAAAAQVKGKISERTVDEPAPAGAKTEARQELKEQPQPASDLQKAIPAAAKSANASEPDGVIAAILGLEAEPSVPSSSAADASWLHGAADQTANEPVTMAVAAGAESVGTTSRWTAVSVALAPEEVAISLEHEMQKAYAAFAAAEAGHTGLAAAIQEPVDSIPASPAPIGAQGLSAAAGGAPDAVQAAMQEFERVVGSYLEQKASEPEPTSVAEVEPAQPVDASAEDNSVLAVTEAQPETPKFETTELAAPEAEHEELKNQEEIIEESKDKEAEPLVAAAPEDMGEPVAAAGQKESDIAESTAAAWASWRRVREFADPQTSSAEASRKQVEPGTTALAEASAMAVAAGAEKTPEETFTESESDTAALASIVDSVLADLRPKIFEEISRKMKKK